MENLKIYCTDPFFKGCNVVTRSKDLFLKNFGLLDKLNKELNGKWTDFLEFYFDNYMDFSEFTAKIVAMQ